MRQINDTELKKLIRNARQEGLDPTWLNYGGYYHTVNPLSFHPDYRDSVAPFSDKYLISIEPNFKIKIVL